MAAEDDSGHSDRITMTAVLAERMGSLQATTAEGFTSLHRTLADMSETLRQHGDRLTRLETQRETVDSMNRRWEDRNQGRREGDQARAGLRMSKQQVNIAFLAVLVAVAAIVVQAVVSIVG